MTVLFSIKYYEQAVKYEQVYFPAETVLDYFFTYTGLFDVLPQAKGVDHLSMWQWHEAIVHYAVQFEITFPFDGIRQVFIVSAIQDAISGKLDSYFLWNICKEIFIYIYFLSLLTSLSHSWQQLWHGFYGQTFYIKNIQKIV